jgi:hypothetical protein
MEAILYTIILGWLFIACATLVWFKDFQECLIGGAGLFMVLLGTAAVLYDSQWWTYTPQRSTLLILGGLALFVSQQVLAHVKWFFRQAPEERQKLFF